MTPVCCSLSAALRTTPSFPASGDSPQPPSARTRPSTPPLAALGVTKLGVVVEPGEVVAQGSQQRPAYLLEMALVTAKLRDPDGRPRLLEPSGLSTAYVDWRWAHPDILVEAAQRGSLCCQLLMSRHGAASAEIRP